MLETTRIGDLTVAHARPRQATRPPVLFVHGIFVDARLWSDWLPFFAERGFPAFAVNLRGRAGSRLGTNLGGTSINDYVNDAAEIARYLGRPAVIGHSMGGLIAQRLAALNVVRAAALITPAPPRGIPLLNPRLIMKQLKFLPQVLFNRVLEPDTEGLLEIAMNRTPRDVQRRALSELVADSGRAGREMSLTGVPVRASAIRCPMLVVAAEDDHFIPARIVAKIAKRYRAPLQRIPEHGHMVVMEPGWQELAADISAWLTVNS